MNKDWHQQHKMPDGASDADRIAWHIDHARNCGCRPIPKQLMERIERIQQKKEGAATGR
jgi:hypothetical protein